MKPLVDLAENWVDNEPPRAPVRMGLTGAPLLLDMLNGEGITLSIDGGILVALPEHKVNGFYRRAIELHHVALMAVVQQAGADQGKAKP